MGIPAWFPRGYESGISYLYLSSDCNNSSQTYTKATFFYKLVLEKFKLRRLAQHIPSYQCRRTRSEKQMWRVPYKTLSFASFDDGPWKQGSSKYEKLPASDTDLNVDVFNDITAHAVRLHCRQGHNFVVSLLCPEFSLLLSSVTSRLDRKQERGCQETGSWRILTNVLLQEWKSWRSPWLSLLAISWYPS